MRAASLLLCLLAAPAWADGPLNDGASAQIGVQHLSTADQGRFSTGTSMPMVSAPTCYQEGDVMYCDPSPWLKAFTAEPIYDPRAGEVSKAEVDRIIKERDLTTRWLGNISWTTNDPKDCIDPGFYAGRGCPPREFTDSEVEIGLRSDGVMVWRKVK